ncbi:uncharacterized protein METZ01_LOCUS375689 [marine metagenome]|uniref:Uncharacterized protein n=1 Tax=marine metagenome TaxID=408172 RepID=A0A382TM15_9ZZZZ
MYNELQTEGYTEVNIIGINGFQYLDNDYHCMICDTPDECSSCDVERVLPWVQDLDDDDNDEIWDDYGVDGIPDTGDLGEGDGVPDESYGDVWESWDISLRDLVFIDRDGNYISRINLTSFNPDPTALGECTDNYETIKQLILSLY